jgi:hypothetical protein
VALIAVLITALAVRGVFLRELQMAADLGFPRPPLAIFLAMLAVSLPASVAIHELGHLIAGLSMGQRCTRFLAWPLEFIRDQNLWRIRLARRSGVVSLVPTTFENLRAQRIPVLAAGPLASLIAALALSAVRPTAPRLFWLAGTTVLCLVLGITQILPFQLGANRSDGLQLWEALRGGKAFDETERDFLTPVTYVSMLRPRDFPPRLLDRLLESPNRFHWYLAYIHHLDAGRREAAEPHLRKLLEGWTNADPPEYALEAAYFFRSREWLERDPRPAAEPWVRLRAEAAVTGDVALVAEALAQLAAAPKYGANQYEIDLLRGLA